MYLMWKDVLAASISTFSTTSVGPICEIVWEDHDEAQVQNLVQQCLLWGCKHKILSEQENRSERESRSEHPLREIVQQAQRKHAENLVRDGRVDVDIVAEGPLITCGRFRWMLKQAITNKIPVDVYRTSYEQCRLVLSMVVSESDVERLVDSNICAGIDIHVENNVPEGLREWFCFRVEKPHHVSEWDYVDEDHRGDN